MKHKLLALASSLSFAALFSQAIAQNLATPPTPGNAPNAQGPCGNSGQTDQPECGGCDGEDSGNSSNFSSSAGTTCPDNTNSIYSYNGNAHRKITDLNIAGSVGKFPLKFTRFSNTRLSSRNLANGAFGKESPWSHNFEWLMRDNGGTPTQPIITITYPEGKERSFWLKSGSTTEWVTTTPYKNPDRIISSGSDFVLHTGELIQYHFKRRIHSVTSGVFYRIEAIKDTESNTYTVSYVDNDDSTVRQVTDAAGHWIKLHYRDESILASDPTKLNTAAIPFDNSNTPPWREITVTPGESFRVLAFYQGNDMSWTAAPRLREIEFYDENNVKITGGTPIGSAPWVGSNVPANAFDGNSTTFYQYSYRMAGYCGIDLGAGNAKKVSRIRYQFTGSSNALMSFVGINNDLTPTQVLSHIEGSDNRQVAYDYTVHNDPSGLFQWVQLSGATYPDSTTASYTYKTLHNYAMPVIDTTNDPRYSDPVKQSRYDYDLNAVIGFVINEYDNATGQLLVSVRWDGPHTPKLVYPNGKANRFEFWGGNIKRSVDSFGGATDYTYTDGFITSAKDPLNRTTTYGRRADRKLTSITTPGGSVTTYTRDTPGYITAVTKNGKTTSYILDPVTKRRTRTNYPDGSYETWTYNSFGQKLTHRLRNATTESWTYDSVGLLTQHTDPAGTVTDYTYNALNRLASEIRNLNSTTAYTTSYEYNDRGQITQITHPDGTFVQHGYDDYGNRLATLDERGQLTQWTYDSLSRKLTETDPNGNVTSYNYTSSMGGGCGCNTGGLPVTITYPDGTITLNTYDVEWRLTSTTVALGTPQAATTSFSYDYAGQRSTMTDPLGRVTTYSYDADGRLISETQASGTPVALTTTRSYSVDGNLLSATQAAGSPAAVTTTMSYDSMDRVLSTTKAAGTPIAATSSSAYNALGQMVSSTDPLGRVTTYAYDAAGRPTDTTLPDGTLMRSVYDAFSRTVQSISAFGQPEQAVTAMTYDSRDRAITQTDPTGVTTTTTYDGGGLPLSVTTPSGKSVAFVYDANGNRLQTITAPGTPEQTITTTTYDNRNRPGTITDGEGSVTITTYDRLNRTLTVKDALNNTTTYTYDLLGNPLTTKAADNVITSTRTYDALNRLTSDKDGENQTITYQYDALGRKTAYTDAKGATFSFQFDVLGRLTRRTEPDATFQTYTYDIAGRLLVHTKADGATKTHLYENTNRDFLTKITYSNGEAPRVMTYDRLGRLLGAANANSTITRTYDAASRQLSETQALTGGPTGSFIYQYDTDGNLQRHTRPDGSFIDYAWNARNLLASVTSDAPPPLATYTYNGRNQIASTVVENGLFTATRTYDAAGRLTGITSGAGVSPAASTTTYTLSPDGRRTGITRDGNAETYGYDNARQVTSAAYPDLSTTQSWNYDAAGNRSSATTNGSTTTYTANSVNEYVTWSGGILPPSYDPNGNQINSTVRPLGSSSLVSSVFSWNINNELITATNANGDSATYKYDALGRRVATISTINNQLSTIHFFYNGWNVELEHDGTTYSSRHTWGLDLGGADVSSANLQSAGGVGGLIMVEMLPSGGGTPVPSFPTYDGNGNITAWVNASGTITARQRYDAYGTIIAQTGTAPSPYGFSTKPQDQVTGLLYYGYRYYDPVTGRWPSRDPIEEEGGINLYGFVGNDGINLWDNLGNAAPIVVGIGGGAAGAVALQAAAAAAGVSMVACLTIPSCRQAAMDLLAAALAAAAEAARCELVRAECIAACTCSEVGRKGGNFYRCMHDCMDAAGCPYHGHGGP